MIAMARKKYQLNPGAMKILSVIASYQPISPTELVEHTSSDSPKVARAIGYLSEQGLVERIPDPVDGRRALIRTTGKGAKVNADIDRLSRLVETKIMSALSESERKVMLGVLKKLELTIDSQLRGANWSQIDTEAEMSTGAQ